MKCDRCQNEAKPKTITARNGKTYDGFECVSGCKNPAKPKYAYFFFPPKETPQGNGKGGTQSISILQSIDATLKRIETILANSKAVHTTPEELSPDESVPF